MTKAPPPCRHSALDLAMLAGHTGCADYLQSVGTPSSGGRYHRAAITIQYVWRFYRHKVCTHCQLC